MDLTTLARVKAAIGIDTLVTTHDTLLEQIITDVSADMERSLARKVETTARTQAIPHVWPSLILPLDSYPVTSISTIKCSPTQEWTDAVALVAASDYVLDATAGVVRLLYQPEYLRRAGVGRPIHPTYFQVVYTGGMAANTAAFLTAYPDLAAACDAQVRYFWQRRDAMGSNSNTSQGATSFKEDYDWLPHVARALAYHRRRSM